VWQILPHITKLPGSGRGAGRGLSVPSPWLEDGIYVILKRSYTSATPTRKCAVGAVILTIKEDK
jgi:hypothetical protein